MIEHMVGDGTICAGVMRNASSLGVFEVSGSSIELVDALCVMAAPLRDG